MKDYTQYLSGFVNERRLEVLSKIISQRTRYLTMVLEDIYQPQNASAVIRSCDAFGIQDIHIIENKNKYRINPKVTHGCDKWLTIHHYNKKSDNTLDAINNLRNANYRIIATSPAKESISFDKLDVNKGKIALFFGTELTGLSNIVMNNADEMVRIPMHGFSESLNLSVSAALIAFNLMLKIRGNQVKWKIQEDEAELIYIDWLKKSLNKPAIIEKYYFEKIVSKGNISPISL
jgi:tRNA (guanosine-2'-O-)-methyltransferase